MSPVITIFDAKPKRVKNIFICGMVVFCVPGDMNEKIDPYLRPIYDALYEMLGFDKVEKLLCG
jgi:predicted ribonuclease YlaK